ncbi:hypothetical protein FQN60_013172 [Etheostoma spectabile]|uniref:receptor protein-tyrosine kinase n=1 Tax=Etheostoma spectabile TaxID=54343 RepID=A0A5J5D6X7_9PERO|nr:hypothetical protein FQN60_013172 [Etheostoma spectabile]
MMAQAVSVIPLFGIILKILCVAAIELRFMPDPPLLDIHGIHRMNRFDNLELTCRGRQYLRWTTPPTSSRFSISDCSGSGLFCTALRISNATVNETGQYQCSYRDLKVEDGKTSAAAYVFVREYEVVFIREGERVVIPCRGSVENLNVTLHTKYPNKELHPDGKDSLWDARTGFTVPSHLISYAGVVSCQTRIGNETFKSPLYIVAVVGYKIYELTLTPTHVRLSVGERLGLSCTAKTELNVGIEFNWTHSGRALTAVNGSRTSHSTPHKKKLWNSLELSNTLIVENVTVDHTGEYTCTASSGQMEKSASAFLKVYEKPFIDMKEPWTKVSEVNVGDQTSISVKYSAYPEPDYKWLKNGLPLKDDYRIKQRIDALIIRGVTEMDAGNYTMVLTNKITKEEQRRSFQLLVNGISSSYHREGGGLEVSVSPSSEPLEEDRVVLRCKADRLIYGNLAWFRVTNISESDHFAPVQPCRSLALSRVEQSSLQGTNVALELSLANASRQDEGLYACQVENIKTQERTCLLRRLSLKSLEAARILNNLTNQKVNVSATISLLCDAAGTPKPTVVWTKNNHTVVEGSGVILSQHNHILTIQRVKKEDSGLYTCSACNSRGCDTSQAYLTTEETQRQTKKCSDQNQGLRDLVSAKKCRPSYSSSLLRRQTFQRGRVEDGPAKKKVSACAEEKTNVELIVPIGSVVIAMFFWLLIVFVIRGRKREKQGHISAPLSHVDPQHWLGPFCWKGTRPSGGDLKEGYLSMILDSEDIPMDEQCERLTYDANKWEFPRDRLKLGDPLGRGAFGQVVEAAAFGIEKATTCTTVAVKMLKEGATSSEYRALMSELKILIHIGHHLNVVNLLGACTKPGGPLMVIVEYCKHGNLSSYLKSKRGEYSPYKRKRLNSQKWASAEEDVTEGDLGLGKFAQLDICTGTAVCSTAGDRSSGSNVDMQEESSDDDHLTMEDLICYSFQVSKGMEFLSSRKCIHRDLAARNILLSENNVVKICDFGLARDVYKDPDYVRKGDARLPLKWMAPETIFDRVYTTQRASPYPGVCIDELFCRRLKEGTRMRPPEYATTDIYQTMLDCWLDRPTDRPTFAELVGHLGNLLQASAQQVSGSEAEGSPVTPDPRSPYSRPQSGEVLEAQLHYDKPPSLGSALSQQSERCSQPLSIKMFEDIPVARSSVMEGHTDSGMGFSPEVVKGLNQQLSTTPTFSQLLRCKSKESLASESSNQTSGYQSGYHSDDADTPIYANEEMIMKHKMLKKPPLPKTPDKFNMEIRYSTPPV